MSTNRDLNYKLYIQCEEDFIRTPFNKEFERYRAISSGDIEKVRQNFQEIKKNYTVGKGVLSDDPLRNIRYHFIISVAMVSRMCIENGLNHDIAYTLSDIYIRRADKSNSGDEIIDMLGEMFTDYTERMQNVKKNNVISIHIRKCIDYILDHLHEKLTVPVVAGELGIDPTYLSKLFFRETGTTFRKYINSARIRVAENMIKNSELSFLEISVSLGFSSQSAFITAFKNVTEKTPGEYKQLFHNIGFNKKLI